MGLPAAAGQPAQPPLQQGLTGILRRVQGGPMVLSGLAGPRVGLHCQATVRQGGPYPLWECQCSDGLVYDCSQTLELVALVLGLPSRQACTHRCTELLLLCVPAQAVLGPCRLGSAGLQAVLAECTLCRTDALQGRRGVCCGQMAAGSQCTLRGSS